MFYLIGDIHGYFEKLVNLFNKLKESLSVNDTIIFLGDYIDRGEYSFEVVDYLISISHKYNTVFLKGNHEDMLMKYLQDEKAGDIFLLNGGDATIRSYKKNCGEFKLPKRHEDFLHNLKLYYEGDNFIAVHAGLNPSVQNIEQQDEIDLIWIREKFFKSDRTWEKTIIFGHTPTIYISSDSLMYDDPARNIIGLDSGLMFGRSLLCLRWPDRVLFKSD